MKNERVERIREYGFGGIHLFGNLYLCRLVSKDYKHFDIRKYIWVVCNLKDVTEVETISIKANVDKW